MKSSPIESAFSLSTPELRPGLTRLLVSCHLVRHANVSRFPRFDSAASVFKEFRSLANLDREVFLTLLLDQRNRCTGLHVVSVGSLGSAPVHPREVFKTAILGSAAAIVLIHQHPSGDPRISAEDRTVTQRLVSVGKELGIPVMDHVVIGADSYYSFSEQGLL